MTLTPLSRRALPSRTRTITLPPLLCDFLAPSLPVAHNRISIRYASTSPSNLSQPSSSPPPSKPQTLSPEQRAYLSSALRVNQAGELAATLIYAAQTPPLLQRHPHLRPLMTHMHAQEVGHLTTFNALLAKHRVRPTALVPVWTAAASLLGWGTALMGREAAMACTEAVETEIGTHYNNQVRELLKWTREEGDVGGELRELVETLKRIRDEELEHLDEAVANDAKEARPYEMLTDVIRWGCRGAIWASERV
jgi:ubiquinone biosynthesis monooxygenase Coq7